MSDAERRLRSSAASHESWARTEDRSARTLPGRLAREAKFLEQADGDPKKAEQLRKAFYKRMAARSVEVRRRRAIKKMFTDR